jgi:SAM-dependent methyltransferase
VAAAGVEHLRRALDVEADVVDRFGQRAAHAGARREVQHAACGCAAGQVGGGSKGGVEVGGAAPQSFGLDTINVDRTRDMDTVYKREELACAGIAMAVDVVAEGDDLPFPDGAFDFVLASHVLEHLPDPIRALREWQRVARRYLFVVLPHRDRTFDRDRPVTPLSELIERHANALRSSDDRHWTVWTGESFLALCAHLDLPVLDYQDPDDKQGNGFAAVLDAR